MGKQADLKRAQTGLESRISWFVLVLLTIQPLLDVMSYFLNLQGKTAISTLLRFGLLAVVALVGFLLTKAKKMYLLLFGVVALFLAHWVYLLCAGHREPFAYAEFPHLCDDLFGDFTA